MYELLYSQLDNNGVIMMNKKNVSVLGVLIVSAVTGCLTNGPQCVKNSGSLNAKHIVTLEGFKYPESALYDAKSGNVFVSNLSLIHI